MKLGRSLEKPKRRVLAKDLSVGHADLGAAVRGPVGLAAEVFVNAVLAQEPVALGGVAGQHRALGVENRRDIDMEPGRHSRTVAISASEGIDKVEVRNLGQGGSGVPLPGGVVG